MSPTLKRAVSRLAYRTLVGAGTTRVLRHLNRTKVPILMYHGFHDGEISPLVNFDGMYVHVDRFERQMRYLARHYTVVPLERSREAAADGRRIAITFDDGYASVFRYAYPVLKALRLPATVFVSTAFVQRRTIMWWDRVRLAIRATRDPAVSIRYAGRRERFVVDSPAAKRTALVRLHTILRGLPHIERERVLDSLDGGVAPGNRAPHEPLTVGQMHEMAAHGISFQSHGVTHAAFSSLTDAQIKGELRDSKATIERWLDRPVTWFAYPFGDRDPRSRAALEDTGYVGAVSCRETLSQPTDDRFAVPRVAVGDPISMSQFVGAISGLRHIAGRIRGIA
jgi:peptidoglycan/xylan/chitin deacetylase (PgdA/CDA1 family)